MKNFIITSFAILGVIFLLSKIYDVYKHESITSTYWDNVPKVKVGMSLSEARTIIGDERFASWTQDDVSGEIIIELDSLNHPTYSVQYDYVFAASDSPKLEFDPNTLKITKVIAGE